MEKAKEICIELLEQRGYTDIDTDNSEYISAKKPTNDIVYVFFCLVTKFSTDKIQEYVSIMNDLETTHSIIIYKDTITSYAKKVIDNLSNINTDPDKNIFKLKIELFNESELQFNITKHVLQPKFKLLSPTSSKNIKKLIGKNIPVLLKTKPISKFYGFESGSIIEITKNNGYITYCIVK